MKIKELMTKNVVTVSSEASLKDVAGLLAQYRVSGLPVVDAEGTVVGVISEADILLKELGDKALTAEQAMTSPARTIGPERPVAEAAKRMIDEHVNRFPVVDRDDKLIGIVTRADLVRAFVRSDDAIASEIREDVILKTLWIAPETLDVSVHDGAVQIGGQVETKSDARLIEEFVRRVPGTVSVESHVTWVEENGRKH
jgi:CBS domain-containing protein